ncbi:MAG: hypothetical protein KME42_28545 [Tildeniella nuda ZEHNDER 1965/U140]|nr:hypothetical protein [Tildeniella nuda ZEHNDER 1965/U140]
MFKRSLERPNGGDCIIHLYNRVLPIGINAYVNFRGLSHNNSTVSRWAIALLMRLAGCDRPGVGRFTLAD